MHDFAPSLRRAAGCLAAGLALVLGLAGCNLNGHQTYPGASVWQAPDDSFHFHYLSPPWRVARPEGILAYLVVDGANQYSARDPAAVTYKLWIRRATTQGGPHAAATALSSAARTIGRTIDQQVATITTRTGEVGYEYLAHQDYPEKGRLHQRETVFVDAAGRLVQFTAQSLYELDTADMDALLQSFSTGPDEGTETPGRKPDASNVTVVDLTTSADGGGP